MLAGAIRLLVEDPEARPVGLHGPRGRNFCGDFVDLSPSEIDQATLQRPGLVPLVLSQRLDHRRLPPLRRTEIQHKSR